MVAISLPTEFSVPIGAQPAHHRLRLHLLDLDVAILSNSAAALAMLRRMYGRFVVPAHAPGKPAHRPLAVQLLVAADGLSATHTVRIGDDSWQLPAQCPADYLYDFLLHRLLGRVRSHIVIHAGVVARHGQATVLVGESGFGKSTLALELVRRGYRFLSDEFAAIRRATGEVDPFPRCLRLRPDTLARVGAESNVAPGAAWQGKHLVDIEHLWPDCVGAPAAIQHVVLLGSDDRPTPEALQSCSQVRQHTLRIRLARLDDALLADLRQADGVSVAGVRSDVHGGWVTLRADVRADALAGVEACCRRHRVALLDVVKRSPARPGFDGLPVLAPITQSQMLLGMVRAFQATDRSLLVTAGGSVSRLVAELAGLVRGANAYALCPGDLQATADLIEELPTGEIIGP